MREVDQLQHAIDHGVAERDQGIDGADGERVDQLLQQEADHPCAVACEGWAR